MLILGFLLVLLATAVITYVLLATAGMPPVEVSYGPLNVEVAPLWLFLSGVITLAVGALGLWLIGVGARTKARKAREVRELRKQAKESDRRAVRTTDVDRGADRSTVSTRPPGSATAPPTGQGLPRTGTNPSPATERNRLEPDR